MVFDTPFRRSVTITFAAILALGGSIACVAWPAAKTPAHQFIVPATAPSIQQAPPLPIEPDPRAGNVGPLWLYPGFPAKLTNDLQAPNSPEAAVVLMGLLLRQVTAWPIQQDRSSWTRGHLEHHHAAAVRYASRLADGGDDIWCEILGRDPRKFGDVLLSLRRD